MEWIWTIVGGIASLWLGSMEFRMRNLENKMVDKPNRDEVSEEIKVRQESIKVLQQEIKEDIKEIKSLINSLKIRSD